MAYLSSIEVFIQVIASLVGGALLIAIGWLLSSIAGLVANRNLRRFWKPIYDQPPTIVVTEYPITGNSKLARVARIAAEGMLISKGNALAMHTVSAFLNNSLQRDVVRRKEEIKIIGDKGGRVISGNVVVIGSAISNSYGAALLDAISFKFDIPYSIQLSERGKEFVVSTNTGHVLSPLYEDGFERDYAIVIRAKNRNQPYKDFIYIGGCSMDSNYAAALAITQPQLLNKVWNLLNTFEDIAFVIESRSIHGTPIDYQIARLRTGEGYLATKLPSRNMYD